MPSLPIYDVLMDPEHPGFLNLGRLLWTLVASPWDWVDRRVETVSLVGERRFKRHMSVDCRVPHAVTDLAAEMGLDRFFVPLRLVAERPLLSFDLQLGDQPVPFLTSRQSVMAERAVLRAAVGQLGYPVTTEVARALDQVAQPGQSGAAQTLELLGLAGEDGGGTATPEGLVRWAVDTLDRNVLLLADVGLEQIGRRTLFKISEELGPEGSGSLPFLSEIAWRPTGFVFGAYDVVATSSYHFQFIAPDGLVVAGGDLVAVGTATATDDTDDADDAVDQDDVTDAEAGEDDVVADDTDDANGEDAVHGNDGGTPETGDRRAVAPAGETTSTVFSTGTGLGQVLGVSARVEQVPAADSYYVEVRLRPSPDGLLRASAISACFTTVLLALAVLFAAQLDDTRLESSTALMLVLPGIVSTMWLRPGEHSLVSRLLRGTRTLLLASVVTIYTAAAAVLVVGDDTNRLRVVWLILALLSALPAGALVRALRYCRSFPSS